MLKFLLLQAVLFPFRVFRVFGRIPLAAEVAYYAAKESPADYPTARIYAAILSCLWLDSGEYAMYTGKLHRAAQVMFRELGAKVTSRAPSAPSN